MDETGHTALPDQVSESRYRALFESSPISLWEEDFSGVLLACRQLQDGGVKNLGAYLLSNPTETLRLVSLVRVVDVNQRTVELFEASSKADLLGPIGDVATDDALPALAREFAALVGGGFRLRSGTSRADVVRQTARPARQAHGLARL
ncbi:MAG: PAS domain-containing protein [Coriobacteriia bacterium]|nr:PAS domain-containing protein [Coriobacteriia bacterium]